MKKKLFFILLLLCIVFSGCATTSGLSGIGSDGKYVGPVVTGQHGEKMVIPNGGVPGIQSIGNLLKAFIK